MKRESKRK